MSNIKDFIRGSQTTFHSVRMFKQGMRTLVKVTLISIVCSNMVWIYYHAHANDFYALESLSGELIAFVQAWISQFIPGLPSHDVAITAGSMAVLRRLFDGAITASLVGLGIALFANLGFWFFLRKRGVNISDEKLIRGATLSDKTTLKKLLKSKKIASDITIAGVPIVKDSEVQHIMITGSTGTGKTVCISTLLEQIRKKGQRAIVYDKMGTYTERFFREGKDVLLNPLDARFPGWNIWSECDSDADFDRIAESLMPMPVSGQDPFWTHAARIMFAATSRKLKCQKPSTSRLLNYLLMSDLKRVGDLLVGTEAESLVSEDAAKMALSVKAVLAVNLRAMRYLEDVQNPFSIKKWVQDEKDDSWLFITSREDQHATLRPLIATWLDVASSSILSLPPSTERRIWLVLDEIGSLHRLPTLPDFLEQSRQFGGCGVLGFHTLSQFYKNFGRDCTEEILGVCNTGVHFRSTDKLTADYVSHLLGEQEIEESQESISYGANTVRDGVSLNERKTIKRLVLPTEIQRLNDLEGFLRLRGGVGVCKILSKYKLYGKTSQRFIQYSKITSKEANARSSFLGWYI